VDIAALFLAASLSYGLPIGVLDAICQVETGSQPVVITPLDGHSASYGVCQIKLRTARSQGFVGTPSQLFNREVNIEYAARYFRYQLDRYQGNVSVFNAYFAAKNKEWRGLAGGGSE